MAASGRYDDQWDTNHRLRCRNPPAVSYLELRAWAIQYVAQVLSLPSYLIEPEEQKRMGVKLVSGSEAKTDREIELRLEEAGDKITHVFMYEDGVRVSSGRLGEFRVSDGKLQFNAALLPNIELVHRDDRLQTRCR